MTPTALQDDVKKVAIGAGVSLFGGVLGKGLFFISQILIARILGVEGFGLYALGFAIAHICDIIAKLGLHLGGMRFVSIYKTDSPSQVKGTLIAAFLISILNSVIIATLLYLFSGKIAVGIFHNPELAEALKLFSYSIPFVAGLTVLASMLQGFHNMKYPVYTKEIIQPGAYILLIILFYYLNYQISGVIYAFVISYIIAMIIALYYLGYLFPGIKKESVKPVFAIRHLLTYSLPLLFVGVLQYLIAWTDTLMLGWLATGTDVGIYRAAYQIPFIMTVFLRAAISIYAPVAADLYEKGEMDRLALILKATTRWVTYATIPLFFLIVFLSKEIMMLFGQEYSTATGYLVLTLLAFGQAVNCMTGGVGNTLTMTGRQILELVNSTGLVLLSIVLNLHLIPKYGALGAAMSSTIAFILVNVIRTVEVYYIYNVLSYTKELVIVLIAICVMAVFGSTVFHGLPSLPKYFIISAGVLLITGTLIMMIMKTSEDRYLFNMLINKVFNRGPK